MPAQLLSFNVQLVALPDGGARGPGGATLMERLARTARRRGGGGATGFPTVTPQRATRFAVEGRTLTADEDGAYFIAATPGYFGALRTPVLQGRAIDDRDDRRTASRSSSINRTLARQLFPNGDAVGHRLKLVNPEQSREWRTIVGVVGDVKYRGLDEETSAPAIYTPFAQTPFMWLYVMVRSAGGCRIDCAERFEASCRAVHPSLTAANIRPMTDVLAQSVSEPRFNMLLVSAFALLALLLSAIGIYGVIAYSVAQRTHEIGVRMALGARGATCCGWSSEKGAQIAVAGVALGVAGRCGLDAPDGQPARRRLSARSLAFAGGALMLLVVGLVATYVPARRATRVEPMTMLRE